MPLFKGALTARRYRVVGDVPDDFQSVYTAALKDGAFREPASAIYDGETVGWVNVDNLLDTDFDNLNRWLFNHYLVACLRVDKKVLPAKLFKAMLAKRIQAWCGEHQRDKCPASVRTELKDLLRDEMLARTLPRVQTTEFCWNVADGWLIVLNTSERANELFRKTFYGTFGMVLAPFSPLDFLDGTPDLAGALEIQGASDLSAHGGM